MPEHDACRTVSVRAVGSVSASICLATLLWAAAPAALPAQSVGGRVLDDVTGAPIGGALLRLLDGRGDEVSTAVANDSGRFVLRAPGAGSFRLEVESVGYMTTTAGPVRLEADGLTEVELRVSATAVRLDALTVIAQPRNPTLERVDFYRRRRTGLGVSIDRAEIESQHHIDMASLLRGRPGVRLLYGRDGSLGIALRGGVGSSFSAGGYCPPRVFINGALVQRFDLAREIHPDDLEGIEIFPSAASVPAQFGGASSSCGVVLLWIRAG